MWKTISISFTVLSLISVFSILFFMNRGSENNLPKGFVYINDIDPTIQVNLKYFTKDNFIEGKCLIIKRIKEL